MDVSKLAKILRDVVFVWGVFVAVTTAGVAYYHDCEECLSAYYVELILAVMMIFSSVIIWVSLNYKMDRLNGRVANKLDTIQSQQVKSEVDRLHIRLKDRDYLTADEFKYLEYLKEQMAALGVNSFTERKITALLNKDIRD